MLTNGVATCNIKCRRQAWQVMMHHPYQKTTASTHIIVHIITTINVTYSYCTYPKCAYPKCACMYHVITHQNSISYSETYTPDNYCTYKKVPIKNVSHICTHVLINFLIHIHATLNAGNVKWFLAENQKTRRGMAHIASSCLILDRCI